MSIVWLNGALVAAAEARIDPADRGFTLGDGVFETIRAEDGAPLHTALHFARLREGAAVLGIAVRYGDSELASALESVMAANGLREVALRLTLTRGPAARGVLPVGDARPTILVSAGLLPRPLPPARLIISRCTRRNEFSPLSRIKSLNYLDSILARQEAQAAGADDALLLNSRGDVAEATAANLFLWLEGRWITPRLADGALPGIARQLLLQGGFGVEERIAGAELARVQAGFLVNSLSRRDIAVLDGRELAIRDIRAGKKGPPF